MKQNYDNNQESELLKLYQQSAQLRAQKQSLFEHLQQIELRYLPQNALGSGGMKEILDCHDEASGRQVAMARLKHDGSNAHIEHFLREARITASLQHANIVPIYDIGIDENQRPFFTMKKLDGCDLNKWQQENQSSYKESIEIFKKVCEAIAFAHSQGVLHLDLKPQNVQIGHFGEVTVCDWGLARLIGNEDDKASLLDDDLLDEAEVGLLTRHGELKGTPGYMSPEQMSSATTNKSTACDIYALGALLYTLFCGEAPIDGKDFEELRQKTLAGQIKALQANNTAEKIPAGLEAICLKALALQPAQRYRKVEELIDDLEAWQRGFAPEAEEASFPRQLQLFLGRHRLTSSLILLFIFISLGYGIFFISEQNRNFRAVQAQKLTAEKNLADYLDEKKISVRRSQELARELYLKANEAFIELKVKSAMNIIDKALLLAPNNSNVNSQKAKLLFLQYRFDEALPYFRKAGGYYDDFYSERCLDLAKHVDPLSGKLSTARFLQLVENTSVLNTVSKYMMRDMVAGQKDLATKVDFAKKLLLLRNPQQLSLHFEYDQETQSLDLSANPLLNYIDALAGLPLKKLNLSGSSVRELIALKDKPLKELNLSGTTVTSLYGLNLQQLRRLDLSHTHLEKLPENHCLKLEYLDLRQCRLPKLHGLKTFKELKQIHITEEWYPPQQIKKLSKRMRVN